MQMNDLGKNKTELADGSDKFGKAEIPKEDILNENTYEGGLIST